MEMLSLSLNQIQLKSTMMRNNGNYSAIMGQMQSGNCPIAYEKTFCYNRRVRWEF